MTLKTSTFSGISESRGHHFYTKKLGKDSIVLDLGSHLGEFSTEVSNSFGCKCYAVEALPELYQKIKESSLIKKLNYAIADSEKTVSFCVSDNPEGNHVVDSAHSSKLSQKIISVNGRSLSQLMEEEKIENIDLLKIDIEGSEISLFDSTSDEVLEKIDQVSIEFHDFILDIGSDVERIVKRLKSLGFICVRYSFHTNGDVLFLNQKRLNMGLLERLYISLFSRYFRGLPRALRKAFV